ncbi:hypothetical protein GCM10023201_32150 [Actinomycetospora corticicola]
MAPVLLPDQDDERDAVDPGGREGADRVAQARRRVEDDQRGAVGRGGVAGGEPDDGALVQREDEVEVVGQAGEQRDLGRPGVREDAVEAATPEDVERGLADGGQDAARSRSTAVAARSSAGSVRRTNTTAIAPRAATRAKK